MGQNVTQGKSFSNDVGPAKDEGLNGNLAAVTA